MNIYRFTFKKKTFWREQSRSLPKLHREVNIYKTKFFIYKQKGFSAQTVLHSQNAKMTWCIVPNALNLKYINLDLDESGGVRVPLKIVFPTPLCTQNK